MEKGTVLPPLVRPVHGLWSDAPFHKPANHVPVSLHLFSYVMVRLFSDAHPSRCEVTCMVW